MTIWLVFGLLTICSLCFVMWPVFRRANTEQVADRVYDTVVYRDQLAELERDADRGLIDEKEKDSAHNEISRRLLKASADIEKAADDETGSNRVRPALTILSIIAIIGVTSGLYYKTGKPLLPDMPQQKRIADASKNGDMPALIFQLQRYLEKKPKDVGGWKVLAPALRRTNRFGEAANAFAKIMQIEGPKPRTLIDYAESALLANRGKSNERIRRAVDAALAMDKKFAQARFYKAIILQQDGKREQALKQLRTLLEQNPKNLQLQMAVQRQIAAFKSANQSGLKLPTLDKDQRRAAANMTPKERQQMIASMVDRLAERLKENGDNLDGWMRLIQVRNVMGNKKEAKVDLATARKQFNNNAQALARLKKQARELGLE